MLRKKGRIINCCLITCVILSFSSCGKKAENVTDYGKTQDPDEIISGSFTSAEDNTETVENDTSDITDVNSGGWRKLSEELGGTHFSYEKDFSIGLIPANISVDYTLDDSDTLPAWQIHTITRDRIYESEIIHNIFGDTASEFRGEIGSDNARMVYQLCSDFFYENGGKDEPGKINYTYPTWVDEETCFLHTWEGKHNNRDYQLSIAWFSEKKKKEIAFGPKKWGDAIDIFSCDRVGFVSKMGIGPGYDMTLGYDFNQLAAGLENHYQADDVEIVSILNSFLTDQFCLKQPSDTLYPKVKPRENSGLYLGEYQAAGKEDQPFELLFYRNGDAMGDHPVDCVLNGYLSCISEKLSGQNINIDLDSKNTGSFYVTDHGIIAGTASICFDYDECLTDQTNILSFEKTMDCLQENISQELDLSGVNAHSIEIRSVIFGYYPFSSTEKENEAVLLPAWVGWICYDKNNCIGHFVQNAVDGSIVYFYN